MIEDAGDRSWRDPILTHFTLEIAAAALLTVVVDADQVFAEPRLIETLRARRFDILVFDDAVAFRYAYEMRFRAECGRKSDRALVVVVSVGPAGLERLPFDVVRRARRDLRVLRFGLPDLFTKLAPSVVRDLDRSDLDSLYEAIQSHEPGALGENDTKDFILRHVFEIAPELIKAPTDLLRTLLRRHYGGRRFPPALDARFVQVLRATDRWKEWPLDQLVPEPAAFFAFLQERWPLFVKGRLQAGEAAPKMVRESAVGYEFKFAGPAWLPFDHDDIRVYVDDLFVDGRLTPTTQVRRVEVAGKWLAIGVAGDDSSYQAERLARLLAVVRRDVPTPGDDYATWARRARRWAEAAALRWIAPAGESPAEIEWPETLRAEIEVAFGVWLARHYGSLSSLPSWPMPVMVHHIPHALAHRLQTQGSGSRLALVVLDGTSLAQWVAIEAGIKASLFVEVESAVAFAWLPTLTAVSRQAIFAGEPPFFFTASISTTQQEPRHWRRFWEDQGLRGGAVAYVCQGSQEDDAALLSRVTEEADSSGCRILGIVVGTVDQMVHGAATGADGLQASVRHWVEQGHIARLIEALLRRGFEVVVTSDHGNTEAVGIGKPNVGSIADERGARVHVFRDDITRSSVAARFPGTLTWPQIGLPEDYRPLFAPAQGAFITEGGKTIGHGGGSLDEVLVPFAYIQRKK